MAGAELVPRESRVPISLLVLLVTLDSSSPNLASNTNTLAAICCSVILPSLVDWKIRSISCFTFATSVLVSWRNDVSNDAPRSSTTFLTRTSFSSMVFFVVASFWAISENAPSSRARVSWMTVFISFLEDLSSSRRLA